MVSFSHIVILGKSIMVKYRINQKSCINVIIHNAVIQIIYSLGHRWTT